MARVYLGVGSNIDREQNIRSALTELRELFGELTVSTVYQCPAVGFDGDDFYNLVVSLETGLEVRALSQTLHAMEDRHGRKRGTTHFCDRTLDIDLLLYDDRIMNEPGLVLPRGEIERFAFVLKPLAEIAPDLVHPVLGVTMATLWEAYPGSGKELVPVRIPAPEEDA